MRGVGALANRHQAISAVLDTNTDIYYHIQLPASSGRCSADACVAAEGTAHRPRRSSKSTDLDVPFRIPELVLDELDVRPGAVIFCVERADVRRERRRQGRA